ncbi:hypothetical protein JG688_00005237 [Phytophthora aleatoria]|uniref:Uncharacterized protein n=1 Tax=Phytophthora aleatoria TaxID=2496075 RepID=A0A8J5M8R2_9STRA|nr:hypothetical protein JG688_00005237 [Phytophthora aleatoria]
MKFLSSSTLPTLSLSFRLGQDGSDLTLHRMPKKGGVSRSVFIYDFATLCRDDSNSQWYASSAFLYVAQGRRCVREFSAFPLDGYTYSKTIRRLLAYAFPRTTNRSDMGYSLCSVCDEVKRYVEENGEVYEFIPAGLTSIVQHCGLYASRPFYMHSVSLSCCDLEL